MDPPAVARANSDRTSIHTSDRLGARRRLAAPSHLTPCGIPTIGTNARIAAHPDARAGIAAGIGHDAFVGSDEVFFGSMLVVSTCVWLVGLVSFVRTPQLRFHSDLDYYVTLAYIIVLGVFGAFFWLLVDRKSLLDEPRAA